MNKVCIACNKRPARIKFIKIVDGKWQDCLICQTCAMRFASQQGAGTVLKLDHILKGLMEQGVAAEPSAPGKIPSSPSHASVVGADLTCTGCGLSFLSYRNTLILGCSECYTSFRDRLLEDLRRFHGAVKHVGRLPGQEAAARQAMAAVALQQSMQTEAAAVAGPPADLASLKRQLQEAVALEDFELAARLRDEIRRHETRAQERRSNP